MNHILLQSRIKTLLLSFAACFLAAALVLYPEQAFHSSIRGLSIWWDVVFPALLPFFIAAEMMMGFGVVHFLGVLLEPLMRPLFRVPGAGAFVMTVGLISGNPMGAKLTARLREQRMVTREEAERLVAFTSTAGPLFLFGAVAVGFFESTSVGVILAAAHYLSTLLVGFLMRFHEAQAPPSGPPDKKQGFILLRALRAMHRARIQDGRPLGQLLGQSVTSAVQTLLLIGGFIMLFSVLTHLFRHVGAALLLEKAISALLRLFSFPTELSDSLLAGFFEITLGSQLASAASPELPLVLKLAAVSLVIGWNGLSIHAQVASMISGTDIRYLPYFFARIIHGFLAAIITLLLYPVLEPHLHHLPAIQPAFAAGDTPSLPFWWEWFKIPAIVGFVYFLLRFPASFRSRTPAAKNTR
ncbi:sporulation integral membrane protein YlbJ [Staphylospora marina]|uniref:sporulation integral membrane protein YlbJ n=1 Tax=Staphylospora marina TaxID=2490858 RepID=UPI000F5BF221|nr:sporulation integral membrane protein YlbJ [Staphylospora marina]